MPHSRYASRKGGGEATFYPEWRPQSLWQERKRVGQTPAIKGTESLSSAPLQRGAKWLSPLFGLWAKINMIRGSKRPVSTHPPRSRPPSRRPAFLVSDWERLPGSAPVALQVKGHRQRAEATHLSLRGLEKGCQCAQRHRDSVEGTASTLPTRHFDRALHWRWPGRGPKDDANRPEAPPHHPLLLVQSVGCYGIRHPLKRTRQWIAERAKGPC